MERDPEASGTLTVRDGSNTGPILGEFEIYNGSFPQSVRTKSRLMFISFDFRLPPGGRCKLFQPCIRFLLRVSSAEGEFDFI